MLRAARFNEIQRMEKEAKVKDSVLNTFDPLLADQMIKTAEAASIYPNQVSVPPSPPPAAAAVDARPKCKATFMQS